MSNMLNKYMTLVENGTFNTVNKTEKKIVALQAKIKKQEQVLKDGNLSLSKKLHWCTKHNAWVVHDPAECKFDINERINADKAFKSKRKNAHKSSGSKKPKSHSL